MKALIPFRGLKSGKSRLRKHLQDLEVENLMVSMLNRTLFVLSELSIDPVILTTEEEVNFSHFQADLIYDQGISLNLALEQAHSKLPKEELMLFIMPDLPFIDKTSLEIFIHIKGIKKIVPALDGGITAAIGDLEWISKIPFGENSYRKLIQVDDEITVYRNPSLSFDLDTYSDYMEYMTMIKAS